MKTNVLNQGDIGRGKTRSLITLLPTYIDETGREREGAGIEPFLISLEPGAEAALGRNICGAPQAHRHVIHHVHIPATDVPFETVARYISLANSLPLETLIKTADPDRRKYRQAIALCDATADFVCSHCGTSFGGVRDWDDTRAVAIDSLTGMTQAFRQNLNGGKPSYTLPEIGVIQGLIESFLENFWSATRCSAILNAHIERESDPLTGMSKVTVSTVGQKLAPRLVKKPDEVITSEYHDGEFYWSTQPSATEVMKRRRLPLSNRIPADYRQIFQPS